MPDDEKTPEQVPADETTPKQPDTSGDKGGLRPESTRKLQAYSNLSKMAQDKGYENVEEMLNDLDRENIRLSAMLEAASTGKHPEPQPSPPKEKPKPEPVTVDMEARATALRLTLTSDWRDWKRDAGKDVKVSKKELDEVLKDPIMQAAIATKHRQIFDDEGDANFYDLAYTAYQLTRGEKPKKEETKTDEPSLEPEASASLLKGKSPEPGKKKSDEQQFLDDLIPDDAPLP